MIEIPSKIKDNLDISLPAEDTIPDADKNTFYAKSYSVPTAKKKISLGIKIMMQERQRMNQRLLKIACCLD